MDFVSQDILCLNKAGNKLVFIIEVPIVENQNYNYINSLFAKKQIHYNQQKLC